MIITAMRAHFFHPQTKEGYKTKSPCYVRKNTGCSCSILNKDQHGQNTEFFSLKYGSPYIDLNRLEKTLDPFGTVLFYFNFFSFFSFSVF